MLAVGKPKGQAEMPDKEEDIQPDGDLSTDETGEDEVDKGAPYTSTEDVEVNEQTLTLPKGFKLPGNARDGEPFTTTIRGKAMSGKFIVEAIGDMPMHNEATETPEEEASESPEEQANEGEEPHDEYYMKKSAAIKKQKRDEDAANQVFRMAP